MACTAALYLWNLSATGYGNTFYAAASQAGAQSWSAWFFGALDARGFITVDKPPGALWVTGLSVRLFGMNSWSVLVPQALMGVTAVAVLFATVRRTTPDRAQGTAAGIVAGAVLAFTPAAALMFRFNNPDAFLVLLLVIAAYCLTRAVATASWRWLALVGAVMGAAFLTKMLQGFLVLPGFAAAYLLAAQTSWRNRVVHLTAATGVLVMAAGWWVAVVQAIPAGSRPYVGGSKDDTVLDLAFGYNGLSRILGNDAGADSQWGGATFRPPSATTGLHRLFTGEFGNDLLAASRRALRRRVRRISVGAWMSQPRRTGGLRGMERVAAGDGRGVHVHERHRAPLLHRGTGTGRRGTGGAGIGVGMAHALRLGWSHRACHHARPCGLVVGELVEPQPFRADLGPDVDHGSQHRRDCGCADRQATMVGGRCPCRWVGRRRGNSRLLRRDGDDTAPRGDSQCGESGAPRHPARRRGAESGGAVRGRRLDG
jgi:hypothetical protein